MSVEETLAKRAREAKDKVFKQSANLNSGAIYELEVEKVSAQDGKTKAGGNTTWFTPEFKVISTQPTLAPEVLKTLPLNKQPNQPGSSVAAPLDISFDWASGLMLGFLSTLTGEPVDEFGKQYDAGNGKTTTLINELTSDAQPLKGARIMCEAFEKPLRGKPPTPENMRTRTRFYHSELTQAATKKVLGG